MAAEKIKFDKLQEWVKNYDDHAIGRETKNVVMQLNEIKELLNYCESHPDTAKINAIRFYLVRQNEFKRDEVFSGQSQISLVGVPVFDYTDNEFDTAGNLINPAGGYDVTENTTDGDVIFSVFPRSNDHEHSGLCPYNCKGSINSSIKAIR